ncbi:MocR-like pyridoxine biosynthesis transcription factor PdxR [Halarcobacter anaerophilus]|uniref:GntR family transcriptional regulator n=1 Tax=Halarcobacter anaerophilus TaxID=877500 RepID=A0A4Q0Y0W7_9BACT|nr:PLP-dependent aminotransferase family protein [Halarcobacter anaerophilus]QDF28787.1 transcriptional regulator, MocR family (aminotransferase domain) [Halarcobacter anaerophilus]RXJ61851.1 GntR family transcriptional regulator [Halarcobacter anaerophilus]
MYEVNSSLEKPIYVQLYEQIKEDIKNNLKAGEKLPSIRKMATEYKISKNTIQSAYNQLYAEGYIESHPQKGYFVSENLYENFDKFEEITIHKKAAEKNIKYDFYPACLSEDIFPKKTWLRLYSKVLKSDLNLGIYYNSQGDIELRTQIAKYLQNSRAVKCSFENIVITSGFADSMHIILALLKKSITKIAFETPSYRVAKKIFEQNCFELEEIPVGIHGIDLKTLKNSKANLLYITPSHQYNFGVTTPIAKRIEIINWAKKNNCYIIEDDYDSELSYNNRPIPAMQGINNNKQVIYTGTFSKSFSPSLRVAYLVLPPKILEMYKKEFDYSFSTVPIDIQKTLALFIKEGFWDRHLRKVRTQNKKKHDILKEALNSKIGKEIKILREGSGLNLLIEPLINIDFEKLKEKAIENQIKIYTRDLGNNRQTLSMGFGGFKENDIKKAVEIFEKVWQKVKKKEVD